MYRRVLIVLDTIRLGDTLAWIPYCEEFRKTNPKTDVFVQCSHSELFEREYPLIQFNNEIDHADKKYIIRWEDRYREYPLQEVACVQLGIPYKEILPRIKYLEASTRKRVTISTQGTSQAKLWNNPRGWSEVISYLNLKGYEVVCIDQYEYFGNLQTLQISYSPTEGVTSKVGPHIPLSDRIQDIASSELFIGVASGMSWVAWALKVPVVLISGFSSPDTEMHSNIERVTAPEGVCSGCFSTFEYDPSNWSWCPSLCKDEEFECSKSIASTEVISRINKILKIV